jgi:hypothetical protein
MQGQDASGHTVQLVGDVESSHQLADGCVRGQDASDYVVQLAGDMPLFAPEHVLNGSFLHDDWRPDLVCTPVLH